VIVGLAALGIDRVLLMPDEYRLAERAMQGLASRVEPPPVAEILPMPVRGTAEDTVRAAAERRTMGAGCLVVLGGDGTTRAAARGAGEVPILPLSSGTNNVLPTCVEGTIAGLAAAAVASGMVLRGETCRRHKRLRIWVDGAETSYALVDVAALAGRFVGARAVWNADALRQVVVTRASPSTIGISAIAGVVRPLAPEEPVALDLRLTSQGGRRILAPVGPGIMARLCVDSLHEIAPGERIDVVTERPLVLAMDGEREVTMTAGNNAWLCLDLDGPWIVDAPRALSLLAARGYLSYTEER